MDVAKTIAEYMGLAKAIGYGLARRHGQMHEREAFQAAAVEGLWKAALAFDGSKGARFDTYARLRIVGEVLDWTRTTECGGVSQRKRKTAARSGVTLPIVCSLDAIAEARDAEDAPVAQFASPEVDVDRIVDASARLEEVLGLFTDERTRRVMRLYFVDGLTMMVIGDMLGLSESRVCQVIAKGYAAARVEAKRQGFAA